MEHVMPFIWLAFAVVMAICEAATTQLVSIWFVIGAVSAAIASLFTPSLLIQSLIFVFVSLAALLVTRPLVKKLRKFGEKPTTNADRLVGQIGVVTMDIPDPHSVGQVKVMGEVWSAVSESAPIKKDTKIKVLGIDSVKLIVEPQS